MPDRALGEFVELQRGNTYKSALLGLPGPKLLGLGSIHRNGGFKGDNLKSYGGDSDARILLGPGDIYVSLKDVTQSADLLGAVARVPSEFNQGRLTQDTVKLVFRDGAPASLIYWVLRSPSYREFCRSYATGTTNLGLPRDDFLAYPIPDPTPERLRFVALLDALDEKIELNRRMNETLDAMARAIFKDWFVDFGPTRAKMEGREPYLAADIWSLFPDRLDDAGKPEGWALVPLGDIAGVFSGGTPSKAEPAFWKGAVPWISPKAMTAIHVSDSEDRVTDAAIGNGTRLAPSGAVLVMVRGMGLHQGVRISQARRDVTFNQDVKALVPKGDYGSYLLFGLLEAERYLFSKVELSGHGTGKIPSDAIEGLWFVDPTCQQVQAVLPLLDSLNERIAVNNKECHALAATRELLLPKLISGEVRIVNADKITGDAR